MMRKDVFDFGSASYEYYKWFAIRRMAEEKKETRKLEGEEATGSTAWRE